MVTHAGGKPAIFSPDFGSLVFDSRFATVCRACIARTGWKAQRLSGRSCQSHADIVRCEPAILLCLGQTFPANFT
jgi:hypothetical protein